MSCVKGAGNIQRIDRKEGCMTGAQRAGRTVGQDDAEEVDRSQLSIVLKLQDIFNPKNNGKPQIIEGRCMSGMIQLHFESISLLLCEE